MEKRFDAFMERTEMLITPQSKAPESPLDGLSDDDVVDVKTLKTYLSRVEESRIEEENAEAQRYGRGYAKTLKDIGASMEDEELHLKVVKLVTEDGSKFNVRSSNDPAAAAQINYYQALSSLGTKTKEKPNLKKDPNLPPAGGTQATNRKTDDDLNLSKADLEYIERRGLTKDQVKKFMKKGTAYTTAGELM